MAHRRAFAILLGSILLAGFASAQTPGPVPQGIVFGSELRAPFGYQLQGPSGAGYDVGLEYNRYFSSRTHDEQHQTFFGEAVSNSTSMLQIGLAYRPNRDVNVPNTGAGVYVGAIWMMENMGVGGFARFDRVTLRSGDEKVEDYEIGPQFSFWPGNRLYINDRFLYRKIGNYRNESRGLNVCEEDFIQIRHHLTYIVGEEWDFTYSHEAELLAGIHQNFHTNRFTLINYFMLSLSSRLSLGPVAGFELEYWLGPRVSVLTIPIRGRLEYFLSRDALLMAELGYETPTMKGQDAGQALLVGTVSYRF